MQDAASNASRSTIALVRNKSYKTYQLYTIAGKGNGPETSAQLKVFKTVITETFSWLKDRYREFSGIPNEMSDEIPDQTSDHISDYIPDHIPDEIKLPDDPADIRPRNTPLP